MEQNYFIDFYKGQIFTKINNEQKLLCNKFEGNIEINLAIVGSRTILDEHFVKRILNAYKFLFGKPAKVISGGAKGIDTIAEKWANENNIETQIFYPDWNKYGKKAGFIRNEDIIKNCDICLAIWDGESNGTKNDFEWCKKYHKDLIIFNMKEFKHGIFSGFHYKIFNELQTTLLDIS